MTAIEFTLKRVMLPDASMPIDRVQKASQVDSGYLRKNPNHTVLSQGTKEWDGENANLGTQELIVDVWGKNLTQDAGAHQIESDTLLESISQAIMEQAGHLSGGPFGAGTDLITIISPSEEVPDSNIFAFKAQLIYNVLWG